MGRMEHRGRCVRAGVSNLGQEFEREKELGEGELLEGPGEGAEVRQRVQR